MKKKAFLLIIFVLLACMLAGTLAACDRGDDLPTTTPVSWEKYLEDAADRIADSIVLDGGKIGVKFSSDVTAEGDTADPTVCVVEFSFSVSHALNQIYLTAHITV